MKKFLPLAMFLFLACDSGGNGRLAVKMTDGPFPATAGCLDQEGLLQTTPRFGGELLRRANIPVPKVHAGTLVEEQVHHGDRALYATTWLRNKEWVLIVKEDPREELMALSHARLTAVGIVLLGVLLIVFGTVFVSRLMITQLVEADRQKAALDAGGSDVGVRNESFGAVTQTKLAGVGQIGTTL